MNAFKVSDPLKALTAIYPDAHVIQKIAQEGGESARLALARLWLSEGIPYAFKDCPGIYESLRTFIAGRINVDPKEISITGSARIGQSMSPNKLGNVFNEESDLDIFVISNSLFESLRTDFNKWQYQYECGEILPQNQREENFWKSNYSRGEKNIYRGFIDSKIIPNYTQYSIAKEIAQTMWLVKAKLDITDNAPKISSASIRCYRSWKDYAQQISLSLL